MLHLVLFLFVLSFPTGSSQSVDPCYSYTALNDDWRSTDNTNYWSRICSDYSSFQGWYRLFLGNSNARIPESRIELYRCGTYYPLWMTEPHPTQPGEIVTRTVCSNWYYGYYGYCWNSYTIQVKLCHGDYYVYKLANTYYCYTAYCAETYRPVSKTCTVTGPTVIDIYGQVNSIQDRCAYSLVSTPLVPDFHVLANFQERRRKDVSFLDSVTLRLDGPGVYIHLEQGGRVRLNDSTLTLNSSAQLVYGVELSKDQTGVTAKLSLSNLTASVFFDGYTAQIHFTGPAISSLEGLCGNSSRSLSELRLSEYSSTSCGIQYNDTADSTINCNNVTERCNLLRQAPFTSCNNVIDPEPYITACNDTLCKYPAVDGLNCQFLEAYARACSLQGNQLQEGWRSNVGCSPEAFCQNRTCSDHEFCGETVGGDTRCFCRPIFASKYRSTDSLGDPTVCSDNSASLTLVGCLLEDKGINYSALHLNDPTCRGQMDELTHMMTFSFNSSNSCGTVITANNNQVIYRNTIMTLNRSSDVVTRYDQVYIDFSCVQAQPNINTATFKIRDSSVIQHITSGAWNYTLTMKAFADASRTQAVESSTEVQLNQKIWVVLKTDGLDKDKVVVSDSCWATDQPPPTSSPRYNLIINSCANPADPTVEVEENGLGTSTYFSFNMFEFTGSSGEVYLHCKLRLCPNQEHNCTPICNGAARRRRSARATYEGEALISMAWTH